MISSSDRCYLHADRPASVGCQRCDRPICSSCMRQASVGFHCPNCAKKGSQRIQRGIPTSSTLTSATMVLIAVNVVAYLVQQLSPVSEVSRYFTEFTLRFMLFGPSVQIDNSYYQIVTAGFLHGGILHLGFNMYALYILGPYVERAFGTVRFALVYLVSLLGGSLAVLLFNWDTPTLGASGAVLGLAGVLVGAFKATGRPLNQLPFLNVILINLAFPLVFTGISFWGHFGGIVAGVAAGYFVQKMAMRVPREDAAELAMLVGMALVLAVAAVYIGEHPLLGPEWSR